MYSRGLLFLGFLLFCGSHLGHAQEDESLNFCDIPCVNNIYKFYCGEAKCTTGASDFAQIFQLCTGDCVAAVAGEAMRQCLTVTVPDRADWPEVQISVVREIVEFCSGYDIAVDPTVDPLRLKDTNKKLLDTLYDDPEGEKKKKKEEEKEEEKKEKKKDEAPKKKGGEGKGGRRMSGKKKTDGKKDDKPAKQKSKPTKKTPKLPKERSEKPAKDTPEAPSEERSEKSSKDTPEAPSKTKSVKKMSKGTENKATPTEEQPSTTDGVTDEESTVEVEDEEEPFTSSSPDLEDTAVGSVVAEEAGSEIEETLEAFEAPK